MLSRVLRQNVRSVMAAHPQRFYLKELGLDADAIAVRNAMPEKERKDLQLWKQQLENKSLQVSTDDEIEKYVLSVVRDYFRTTKKASLELDSAFADHGLDSLDAIEFVIQIEDELGYMIEAENLELFKKPRHFVNYIKQMEAYKTKFNKLPHEDLKVEFSFKNAFPHIPMLTKE